MECVIGVKFRDFVMLAVDANRVLGGLAIAKTDEDKMYNLTKNMVMATTGEAGDASQFAEYIVKNIHLYKIRNGYEMSPAAAAHFTRYHLTKALRSQPYNVNMLLGGWDLEMGPSLYHMDYLGALVPVPYTAMGYGGFFALSIMDRYQTLDQNEDEAYELMKRCIKEIHQRLIINIPNFKVVIINKDGIKKLPMITSEGMVTERMQ